MNRVTKLMLAGMVSILAIIGVRSGLSWEDQRHPPLPPQASKVGELLVPSDLFAASGGLRQTTYRVPTTVEDVRRFYQQELPRRGWRYCGTQATPGCTNRQQARVAPLQVDVYRRARDRDTTGATIEIQANWNADQRQAIVTVVEASP